MNKPVPFPAWLLAAALAAAGLAGCQRGPSVDESVAAAEDYVAKSDFKAATISAKNALQKEANNAQARLLLGQALLEEDQPTAAAVELRKALELGAPENKAVPLLARAVLAQGRAREVTMQYGATVLGDARASADLRATVATAFALLGDKANALDTAQAALKEWPDHVPATLVLAQLAAADGDGERALTLVEGALAREPKDGKALYTKGTLLGVLRKDPEGALAAYRAAVASEPRLAAAHGEIISLLLDKNDLAAAKDQLAQLVKVQPNHPTTWLYDARVSYLDKNYAHARDAAERLLKVRPNDWKALLLAGLAEVQLKSDAKAENYLTGALKTKPDAVRPRQVLAQLYLRAGRARDAIEVLQPIVDSKTADAESVTLSGLAYLQADDAKRADAAFARAAKIDPQATTARRALALTHLAEGNVEGGFAELEAVASQDPTARSAMALVAARLSKNDLDGALKAIADLQARQPESPVAHALRGSVLARRKDAAGAAASYERALALDKRYFPATAGLAALALAAGRPDEARRRYEDLLREDPKNMRAALAMADLQVRAGAPAQDVTKALGEVIKDHPTEVLPRLVLTNYLLGRNDGKAALGVAQNAVAALPGNIVLLERLGTAQLAAGAFEQAAASFTKLAAAAPDRPDPLLRLAEAQALAKDYKGAQRTLARVLELKPGLVQARIASARVAMAQNQPEAALEIARTLTREQPRQPTGAVLEAEIAAARGQPEAAVAALRRALANGGGSDVAGRLYGMLNAAKQGEEAERMASAWMKEHPNDALFRFLMGDTALAQGRLALAESHYRKVLELQPDNAMALNNVAWLMVRQGKPGAVALAERANQIQPNRPVLMDTLAGALAAEDQTARAIQVQKQAIAKAPDDLGLRLNLARIYVKSGDRQLARAELEPLVKLGDKFPAAREVASLMQQL